MEHLHEEGIYQRAAKRQSEWTKEGPWVTISDCEATKDCWRYAWNHFRYLSVLEDIDKGEIKAGVFKSALPECIYSEQRSIFRRQKQALDFGGV